MDIEKYAYEIPPEQIAQEPAEPRDASRILIYDTATDKVEIDKFWNLAKHVPEHSLLVLNKTKVVPARLCMRKATLQPGSGQGGGKANILFLVNEPVPGKPRAVKAIADRRLQPGEAIFFPTGEAGVILGQEENIFVIGLPFERAGLLHYLDRHGSTPIPPYIKHTPLSERELRAKYQTIFARAQGSAAAPTASLHFTPRVFRALEKRNVRREFLTLHVGLGTFAPVSEENIRSKHLHEEYFDIEPRASCVISKAKNENRPIVAVGTTVVRALESAAFTSAGRTFLRSGEQMTRKFIYPPHRFLIPDIMLTNFHVPKSSLMMLVDAFLEHKQNNGSTRLTIRRPGILDLYEIAIKEKFRFFSFGDAMLIR